MTPDTLSYRVTRRPLGELSLEVAEAGPRDGPLVILLHGFPDLWPGWHLQMEPLAKAGFRVLAPNQRGYGDSDKPCGVAAYDLDHLASDIVKLAASEGAGSFQLVGHDWGGIVAWWTAASYPSSIERLAILNAPHPGVFRRYAWRNPMQLLRSWYVGAVQLPWLPELLLSAWNFELLFQAVQRTSFPGVFDESDRRYLVRGWSAPGSLTAMLNYYRAIVRRSESSLRKRVPIPTLILFGRNDPAEEPGLATASLWLCDDGRIAWFDDCRHWIQREAPDRVTAELLAFLSPAATHQVAAAAT